MGVDKKSVSVFLQWFIIDDWFSVEKSIYWIKAKLKKMFVSVLPPGEVFLKWASRYSNNFCCLSNYVFIIVNMISTPFFCIIVFYFYLSLATFISLFPCYEYGTLIIIYIYIYIYICIYIYIYIIDSYLFVCLFDCEYSCL